MPKKENKMQRLESPPEALGGRAAVWRLCPLKFSRLNISVTC